VPILNAPILPASPGSATVSKAIVVPGIVTFSGGAAWGGGLQARRTTSGISASMGKLLSFRRMNVGHFRADLVEIERAGLEEGMGHVELEAPRPSLGERGAHAALMVTVGQHGIDDAEAGLVL